MIDSTPETLSEGKTSFVKFIFLKIVVVFIICTIVLFFFYILTTPPKNASENMFLQIDSGYSVQQIADKAQKEHVVRSSTILYALLTFFYDPTKIYAGTYHFDKPLSVFKVAEKIAHSDIDKNFLIFTIPEGFTRKDIAKMAHQKIQNFDVDNFLELTKNNEGYLFPETYYISPDFTAEKLVTLLTETFGKKIAPLTEKISQSKFSEYEILILASIIEREANNENSMKAISGILQNRLAINMALQTDASIEYVLDKPLSELTPEDLKLNTPYNTYLNVGLPPTPIGNPGLLAIDAVLNPERSSYLYYITDRDGVFHYAKTFEEHKKNIATYLK